MASVGVSPSSSPPPNSDHLPGDSMVGSSSRCCRSSCPLRFTRTAPATGRRPSGRRWSVSSSARTSLTGAPPRPAARTPRAHGAPGAASSQRLQVGVAHQLSVVHLEELPYLFLGHVALLVDLLGLLGHRFVQLGRLVAHVLDHAARLLALHVQLDLGPGVVQPHVRLVDASEQVVRVGQHVLVSAREEDAQVVRFARHQVVHRQRRANVAQVDELIDLAVRIAADVHQRGVAPRPLVQALQRHYGEERVDGPVVRQALEEREVDHVLVGQHARQELELLRHVIQLFHHLGHAREDAVVGLLDVAALQQAQVAEVEERVHGLLVGDGLVVDLAVVLHRYLGLELAHLFHQRVLLREGRQVHRAPHGADGVHHRHHQHGVVRRQGAARLRDDDGLGHLPLLAGLHDGVDHRVGVLAQVVVGAHVVGGLTAVVVHGQAAAHVQVLHAHAHLGQLHVRLGGLADGGADAPDVGQLAAHVAVEQHQRVRHALGLHALGHVDKLGGGEAELGVVAAGGLPLTAAARVELEAHTEQRLHAHLLAYAQHALQLAGLLEGDDDLAAQLAAPERQPYEVVVLEAVAAEERVVMYVVRQAERQLGLAAGLQAGAPAGAVLRDGLHHHAALVDLDGVDALVGVGVARLGDGGPERLVDPVYTVLQDVREAEHHGQLVPLVTETLDYVAHRQRHASPRGDGEVALGRDPEIAVRPRADREKLVRVADAETWVERGSGHFYNPPVVLPQLQSIQHTTLVGLGPYGANRCRGRGPQVRVPAREQNTLAGCAQVERLPAEHAVFRGASRDGGPALRDRGDPERCGPWAGRPTRRSAPGDAN